MEIKLLVIYLVVSVLTFVGYILTTKSAEHKFKKRYPEIELEDHPTASGIKSVFKLLVGSFIPILHVGLLLVIVFAGNQIEEKAIEAVRKEKENDL